jgi:hypothetical protein
LGELGCIWTTSGPIVHQSITNQAFFSILPSVWTQTPAQPPWAPHGSALAAPPRLPPMARRLLTPLLRVGARCPTPHRPSPALAVTRCRTLGPASCPPVWAPQGAASPNSSPPSDYRMNSLFLLFHHHLQMLSEFSHTAHMCWNVPVLCNLCHFIILYNGSGGWSMYLAKPIVRSSMK